MVAIAVVMIVVVMVVAGLTVVLAIGAAFRVEGRVDLHGSAPSPCSMATMTWSSRISSRSGLDLGRQVPVAEMPGEAQSSALRRRRAYLDHGSGAARTRMTPPSSSSSPSPSRSAGFRQVEQEGEAAFGA